jgi:hypothetical protein
MELQTERIKWVAVKVERGFIVEARGYRRKIDAKKQVRTWIKDIYYNRDFDETEILPLIIGQENPPL